MPSLIWTAPFVCNYEHDTQTSAFSILSPDLCLVAGVSRTCCRFSHKREDSIRIGRQDEIESSHARSELFTRIRTVYTPGVARSPTGKMVPGKDSPGGTILRLGQPARPRDELMTQESGPHPHMSTLSKPPVIRNGNHPRYQRLCRSSSRGFFMARNFGCRLGSPVVQIVTANSIRGPAPRRFLFVNDLIRCRGIAFRLCDVTIATRLSVEQSHSAGLSRMTFFTTRPLQIGHTYKTLDTCYSPRHIS